MVREALRNAVFFVATLLALVIAGTLAGAVTSPRGAAGPLLLGSTTPLLVIGAALLAVVVATAAAIVVARTSNTAVGLFTLGAGLLGFALRLDGAAELAAGSSMLGAGATADGLPVVVGGPGAALAIVECLLWAGLILAAVVVLFRVGGPLRDVETDAYGLTPNPWHSRDALRLAATALLALPIVWFVARTPLKGQVVAAVFLGGMVAGLAGRLVAPHVQPILLAPATVVVGALAQLAAAVMLRGGDPADAMASGTYPAVGLAMPVDWACAAPMGVAVGLGWAKSFLQVSEEATAPAHGT